MNLASRLLLLFTLLPLAACGDDAAMTDGGVDPVDGGDELRACSLTALHFAAQVPRLAVGATRAVWLETGRDNSCGDVTLTIASADTSIATVDESAVIPDNLARVAVSVTGIAAGTATLTASWVTHAGTDVEESGEASFEITVVDAVAPSCSGTGSGTLSPGGEVAGAGAAIALQEGAAEDNVYHVDPTDVSIGCAYSIVPVGFESLGPAITFGPVTTVFDRDVPITVPAEIGLLPDGAGLRHVLVAYQGASGEARVVPVASLATVEGGISFEAPRLGTYQAVVASDTTENEGREYTYRGIGGISMGAAGSALLGFNNPERFDFVAPLGGPVDWMHMLHYIRTWHLGGFCTEAERIADPEGCAGGASTARTPESHKIHQVEQDFEHWNYVDEWGGQGGTFNRRSYLSIFRDLARAFGNPIHDHSDDPEDNGVLPPGVPSDRFAMSDTQRCANPYTISSGFYDDEYNPEGTYPVITFCDGAELDVGTWDSTGSQTMSVEIALAVDLDGDGVRDPGEPVIRNIRENFEDCGLDQLCDADEPGYDPDTNPDPNGDDYDWQYNPNGTEGNYVRDYTGAAEGDCASPEPNPATGVGEIFYDYGLDGVDSTPQFADGGYDNGEGDGCWTLARGAAGMIDQSASTQILGYEASVFDQLDVYSDGGVRDLFNFAADHDNLVGRLAARGMPLQIFNSHAAIGYTGSSFGAYEASDMEWDQAPRFMHTRYGNPDASETDLQAGDGGHVGTVDQAVQRVVSAILWMSSRWPDGDHRRVPTTGNDTGGSLTDEFDFTDATTGRTGPTTVILPPGYYHEDFAETRYPVVYFLHGYGMEPSDFAAVSLVLQTLMDQRTMPSHRRPQKMIVVFADGKCRGNECLRGTFYAEAPENTGGAQMETYFLGLMDYIDENYRTR